MTGTAQCTHSFYNKRMCKSYDCPPYARLHKATDSRAVKSGGRQAVPLYNQLGGVNNRPMGIRNSERLPDPFYQPASSSSLAKPSCVLSRAKPPDTGGSRYPGREVCYYSGTRPSTSRLFLLHSLPGSQKGGSDEASDKPQEIERMGGTPALQDGRYGDSQGIIEDRRLDGEGRPERCLLHNPSTPKHQSYLRFIVGQEHYQFTCLPFGLSCAPWVFTKVMKPIAIFLRSMGVRMIVYIDDILLLGDSPNQVETHLQALVFLLTNLGFIINYSKSITTPTQKIEYLGLLVDSTSLHLSLPGESSTRSGWR